MYRVLWIEDAARWDMGAWLIPVFSAGKFDVEIGADPSDAMSIMRQDEFDAVIVDIRLPPGYDQTWIDLWNRAGATNSQAQLGLKLLYGLLLPSQAAVDLSPIPRWVNASRFGVLSVETPPEIGPDLNKLGIKHYKYKSTRTSETVLLDMIEAVLGLPSAS